MQKIDSHFADGRAHVAGDKITAADFALLATVTSIYENANVKHAAIRDGAAAALQASSNVQRVLAPVKELCAATIAAMPASIV